MLRNYIRYIINVRNIGDVLCVLYEKRKGMKTFQPIKDINIDSWI